MLTFRFMKDYKKVLKQATNRQLYDMCIATDKEYHRRWVREQKENVKTFLFVLFGAGFVFFTPYVKSLSLRGLLLVLGVTLMMINFYSLLYRETMKQPSRCWKVPTSTAFPSSTSLADLSGGSRTTNRPDDHPRNSPKMPAASFSLMVGRNENKKTEICGQDGADLGETFGVKICILPKGHKGMHKHKGGGEWLYV